jgi:hypothetical protein
LSFFYASNKLIFSGVILPAMAEFHPNQPKISDEKFSQFLGEIQLCGFRQEFGQKWWNRNNCVLEQSFNLKTSPGLKSFSRDDFFVIFLRVCCNM